MMKHLLLAGGVLGSAALAGCGINGNVSATPTGNGTYHVSGTVHTTGPSSTSSSNTPSSSNNNSVHSSTSHNKMSTSPQDGVTSYYLPNHFTYTKNVAETFISPQLGWKILDTGVAMGSESANLYHTNNGGTTWALVASTNAGSGTSLPIGGYKTGMSFVTPHNGWLTGSYPMATNPTPLFYHTTNGGGSWQKVSLSLPTTSPHQPLTLMPPAFVSASDAVMVGYFGSTTGAPGPKVDLWVTTNGGTTWDNVAASGSGHQGGLQWDVPNGNTIIISLGGHSWNTTNYGRTWTPGGQ